MQAATHVGLGIAISVVAGAIGAAVFVTSGAYDIGADAHHTPLMTAIIETLRERSISMRAGSIEPPRSGLEDPALIAAGATHYSRLCVGCHLAPGVTTSDLRPGLYPHAPNLAQADLRDVRRAFWTVKHGIKMPAWGKSLDDDTIWEIVAFARRMPAMSPETYQQVLKGGAR
jgi:mono/diheme cytochrome c family protein